MANELKTLENKLSSSLSRALNNAASIITKDYLASLDTYEIMKPSVEDLDIDIAECGKFYKLSKLVLNKEENFLNKLTTIVNVASSIKCSIVTIINSDGYKIDYYFGILSKNVRDDKETSIKRRVSNATAFKGAISGNLTGSELAELSKTEVDDFKKTVLMKEGNCYSSVSGIAALRNKDEKNIESYVQGIENLVDSLKGQKYTVVTIADPLDTAEIQIIKQGYEILHTELSTFAKSMVTFNEGDSLSLSKASSDGISEGISKGISMTQSKTITEGNYSGVNAGVGVSFIVSANVGINSGKSNSISEQTGRTDTTAETSQRSRTLTSTTGATKTVGKSLQLTYENRSVKSLLDRIDKHLERLDECESFGAFDCAAYIIADNRETALTAASNYNALIRGQNSNVQASHINSWFKSSDTEILGKYIGSLVHPRFKSGSDKNIIVTPASVISGDELAIQIGLPKKSVSGITVVPMAPFGRNILESTDNTLTLGNLYHMGNKEGDGSTAQKVKIDIESLAMHTFITGSTGKGKSTAIYSILDKLIKCKVKCKDENIKFMVIEPAKGEYKNRFGSYSDVNVYGTNALKTPLLRINPFSFPEDIHVLEHIDRLIEIFNVCWPMYAAMPAVLKDALERAYIVSGWNLETSVCRYKEVIGSPLFPSFLDVLSQINEVMDNSAYSNESKSDYKGALCTRVKSLTNGLYGQIFTSDELSSEELFDKNVIVDLSRTGSSETKALIMGILVMKLQEYRLANAASVNAPLKHVTVLEEAHNILKHTSDTQGMEGANVQGKSVEMLANSIAEMRTYGEGFIISDQAPGLMDMSVIRNTNTKIILGLPDIGDRELVGRAASLNDEQITELSRLKTFVAAIYQNNWLEPVLCKIDTNFKDIAQYKYRIQPYESINRNRFLELLLLPTDKRDNVDKKYIDELIKDVYKLPIPSEAKVAFIKYIESKNKTEIQRFRELVVYHLFNSEMAFELVRGEEDNIENWYNHIKDILEPSITEFGELEQQKIIALLTREKARQNNDIKSNELFERLMNFM